MEHDDDLASNDLQDIAQEMHDDLECEMFADRLWKELYVEMAIQFQKPITEMVQ